MGDVRTSHAADHNLLSRKVLSTYRSFRRQFSFDKRFALFRKLGTHLTNPRRKQFFDNIVSRISNVQTERQDLTHGIWYWEGRNPHKIKLHDHPRRKSRWRKNYDHQSILQIAQKIAEINFALAYPLGEKQSLREAVKAGSYFSRDFLASSQATEPDDPTLNLRRWLDQAELRIPSLPEDASPKLKRKPRSPLMT